MYTLPLMPYHGNLANHWRENTIIDYDFMEWVEKFHHAQLVVSRRPEVWRFDNEQDMMLFALRWA